MAAKIFFALLFLGVANVTQGLVCRRKDGSRFSSKVSRSHFYECGSTNIPELKKCPGSEVYHIKRKDCVDARDLVAENAEKEPALGRNIQLGALYDARTRMFYPEASPWRKETIRDKNQTQIQNEYPESEVFVSNRVYEKMKTVGVSASIGASILGGLVKVTGSASYFNDLVIQDNEVNIELMRTSRLYFVTLPPNTQVDYPDECSPDTTYTHAVTQVFYGMDAHFVFKNTVKNRTEINEITGTLKASIGLIIAEVTGEIGIDLTVRQEEVMNRTTLQMFGDFSPSDPDQPLPTNLTQAYNFWLNLPQYEGSQEDMWPGASIVAVTLTPIYNITGCTGNPTVQDLEDALMEDIMEMMDDMEQLLQKVGGLLNQDPAIRFKPMRENLNLFKNKLTLYQLEQKQKLQEFLPNIVGGTGNGEDDLEEMLANYTESVFEFHKASAFLVRRQRETNALIYLVQSFLDESNAVVADYESANYIEYIFKKEKVLVLEFNVLTPASLTEHYLENNEESEDNFWFQNTNYTAIIGETLRNFKAFAEQNLDEEDRGYLMKLSEYQDEALGTTTAYRNGAIISEQFEVPLAPPTPVVPTNQLTHEGFKFNITKKSTFTLGCLVSFTSTWGLDPGSIGVEWTQVIEFPEEVQPGQDIEISIEKRHPLENIQFYVQYLTEVGRSVKSEEVSLVTRASSPPRDLTISEITTEAFCISWLPPEAVPEAFNLTQDNFDYVVKIMGEDLDKENRTSELELSLTDLKPGTWYSVTVTAHFNNPNLPLSTYPSFPATSNLMTKPLPPSATVDLTQVKNHEVIFHLEPPSLPENVEPLYYLVLLCRQTGDPQSQDCSKEFAAGKSVAITNVARGNNYTYSAKVRAC